MIQKYGMVGEVEAYQLAPDVNYAVSSDYKVSFGGFIVNIPQTVFEEYFIPTMLPDADFRKMEERFHELIDIIENQSENEPAVIVANRYRELANIIEVIGDMEIEEEENNG